MTFNDYKRYTSVYNCYPKEVMRESLIIGLVTELIEYELNPCVEELGDVLWYCAELDGVFSTLSPTYIDKFEPLSDAKIFGDLLKKGIYRKDYSELEFRQRVALALGNLITTILNLKEFDAETAMIANLQKLESRQNRNVIKGEGDYR